MAVARSAGRPALLTLSLPFVISLVWSNAVNSLVKDPYLDEFFHIRQAIAYIKGQWHVWDPKITTPPGLYLVSWLQAKLATYTLISGHETDISRLRSINQLAYIPLAFVVYRLLLHVHAGRIGTSQSRTEILHVTINILLFPPLFFFTALYYTDLLSSLSVLLTYLLFLQQQSGLWILTAGLMSLFFRQTNVFWVAIYLGALELCRSLPGAEDNQNTHRQSIGASISETWRTGIPYDPSVDGAILSDYVKSSLSIALSAIKSAPVVILRTKTYLAMIICFACFISWNGAVVLGDKSNHVATIHLAQMLYLWVYICFFSVPIVLPVILGLILPQRVCRKFSIDARQYSSVTWLLFFSCIIAALAIVHYGTIVHPFTLADNRHYTFYVFRLLTRTLPIIKYIATPVYIICAQATLTAFSKPNTPTGHTNARINVDHSTARNCSTVLIWLLTTALTLVPAPLVEPRYCILPWILWRIHLPLTQGRTSKATLVLATETVWFLAINIFTAYMFLYRPFEWINEPGVAQRFMW